MYSAACIPQMSSSGLPERKLLEILCRLRQAVKDYLQNPEDAIPKAGALLVGFKTLHVGGSACEREAACEAVCARIP